MADHDDAVGDLLHFVEQMRAEQDGATGIGEATRVLLRRLPWKLLVHSTADEARLGHLYQLAKEKGVEVVSYPLRNYLACGLIRALADN